jgi:hypothetical protein
MAGLAQVTSGFWHSMADSRVAATPVERPAAHDEWTAFRASMPLFVVTVGLFVGSVVVFDLAPAAGPGGFPLWGLLLTLGFIAAIGTTVSWFFANGATTGAAPDRPARDDPSRNGRPLPEVQRTAPVPPAPEWDESGIPQRPPPTRPRPVATPAPPPPDDVVLALEEIAEIEEELENRPRSDPRRPAAPARS